VPVFVLVRFAVFQRVQVLVEIKLTQITQEVPDSSVCDGLVVFENRLLVEQDFFCPCFCLAAALSL
jgi:hypothetical protein